MHKAQATPAASRTIPQTAELVPLGLALLLVVLIGILAYQDWTAFSRRSEQVEITQQIVAETNSLLVALLDAETGQRGYILTGESIYLEPYQRSLTAIPIALQRLATVTNGRRPDQFQRVQRLQPLIKTKLDELQQTIEIRQTQGMSAALAIMRTDRGKAEMDHIRQLCNEIQRVANGRLTEFSKGARSSANQVALVSVAGSMALFVFLTLSALTIQRGTRRRQQLISKLQASDQRTREARDWLQTTLASIGDAVIATDASGRITLANTVAQSLTGWSAADAVGKPLEEIFVIHNEQTGAVIENPVSNVLREGNIVGLANHTRMVTTRIWLGEGGCVTCIDLLRRTSVCPNSGYRP
ncbi:MAG TPA: CHASE3 domain-containing protein [Bryobacteraceae bacterium]|nr:CHASE3 domain-containing protein [Bryobacteraceae bacterium]